MSTTTENIRLTQYSHGAGCGCKISPKVLDEILKSSEAKQQFPLLLVGNENKDDAAVYDLGDGTGIISTTDFFMPIVDHPADFGTIASVNAISDVYAMGGTPLMAIAVLGWPVNVLSPDVANKVLEGSRRACAAAGIPLAGGHSIDAPEPIFGLAVTGRVELKNLKRNDTAKTGASLFLTKPLGIGVLTTAEKKSLLLPEHKNLAASWMMKLNSAGALFGKLDYVCAMTDVTGFGLLGHLCEMCEGSQLSAVIEAQKIPVIAEVPAYVAQKCMPGGTTRNWDSYGYKIQLPDENLKWILADPQTSGGLLVAVEAGHEAAFKKEAAALGLLLESFGTLGEQQPYAVRVI